jgi:hypothetical protein
MAKKQRKKKPRGPYLAAAFFCEQVIKSEDGALTPVRITDQIKVLIPANAPADFPSEQNRLPVRMSGLLSFKSGDFPGEHTLRLVMESPSGKVEKMHEQKIPFSDPPQGGGNLILQNTVGVYKGGLFWFNVYLDGKRMTSIPLEIKYEREQAAQTPAAAPVGADSTPAPPTRSRKSPQAPKVKPSPFRNTNGRRNRK